MKKLRVTFVVIGLSFMLLIISILHQLNVNGINGIRISDNAFKYVLMGLMIGIIIFLVIFNILLNKSTRDDFKRVSNEYLGVDFTEEVEEPSTEEIAPKRKKITIYNPSGGQVSAYIGGSSGINGPTSSSYFDTTSENEVSNDHSDDGEENEDDIINSEDGSSRFYMLSQIDQKMEFKTPVKYDKSMNLKEICDDFRNFACNRLKLYYDIEDIRRFIGGLSVTKLIILQGMSGTGKTSLAYAFGEYLDNKTIVIPIQPMWKERTDLIGYYNEFTKKFNETTLLYKMYEANYNDDIYITVLDEMNIARVEYYFAEFLSLLELPNPDGRNLDVVADKWSNDPKLLREGKLRLPINMWFIGTANNDDSTFAISDKVYDRAMVLNLDKKAVPFEAPYVESKRISSSYLYQLMNDAQKEYSISDRNLRRIRELDKFMIEKFHLTFGNRIMKQIRVYVPVLVACGGTELEAIDDILARKVFRKLESKNPVYVKQMAESVCSYLDELFGTDKLPLCKEVIRLIEQNV